MNTSTVHPPLASGRTTLGSRLRTAVGVVTRRRTYASIVYLLLGLPLGTIWFVVLITGFAVAASLLVVALIGVPLLLALWYAVRLGADVERGVANGLLGCEIERPVRESPTGNLWVRLRAMSADPTRRRELGYLLLRFPVGIATFAAAVTAIAVPLAVAYAPIGARYVDDSYGQWFWGDELFEFTSTSPWSWTLIPLGLLVLIASLHVVNVVATACGRLAAVWLGRPDVSGADLR